MACLWQKESSGVWCITYRQNGQQKVRSLRTTNKREAVKLQREIEGLLAQEKGIEVSISEKTSEEEKDPIFDEFWPMFFQWAEMFDLYITLQADAVLGW